MGHSLLEPSCHAIRKQKGPDRERLGSAQIPHLTPSCQPAPTSRPGELAIFKRILQNLDSINGQKPDTKGHVHEECPGETNPKRQEVDEWMPGAGEDVGSYWFHRNSVSAWEDEVDGW